MLGSFFQTMHVPNFYNEAIKLGKMLLCAAAVLPNTTGALVFNVDFAPWLMQWPLL